jgi:dienelactone hydrolase
MIEYFAVYSGILTERKVNDMCRHSILTLIVAGLLISCSKEKESPAFLPEVQTIESSAGTLWILGKSEAKKRALLIHGLTTDHTQYFSFPPAYIPDYLWRNGWQIIFIDLQHTRDYIKLKEILTPQYRDYWQERLSKIYAFSEARFGKSEKFVVGGISWGGLHSLMAAALLPQISAYFALIPVVDISLLDSFAEIHLQNFSPSMELDKLKQVPGYLAWGGRDAVVNPSAVDKFASQIKESGARVELHRYNDIPHDTPEGLISDLNLWLEKL